MRNRRQYTGWVGQTAGSRHGRRQTALNVGAVLLGFVVLLMSFTDALFAGDWPQIHGPDRNAIATGEQLSVKWPDAGPKKIWDRPVGSGYAGVAVAGARVVLFHRIGDEEIATALDASTGKPLWAAPFATRYVSGIAPDNGPRCVPVIAGDRVVLLGAAGGLHCLELATGRTVWSHDTAKEFAAPNGYFGAGSTPLVHDGRVLVNVGGRDGAGLVAFALSDGKVLWKATAEGASYSAPTMTTIGGKPIAIFVTRLNIVGIDLAGSELLFRIPFGDRGPTVNAATPVVVGNHLFVTASYGIGAAWIDMAAKPAKTVWANDESMSSQYTTPVAYKGYLYGIHGRQDQGVAELRCIDPRDGKVQWTEEGFGAANLILAGDKFLAMKTNGELVLAEAAHDKFRPLAKARVLDGTVQPLPALAAGKLYVRDEKVLRCLEVGSAAAK